MKIKEKDAGDGSCKKTLISKNGRTLFMLRFLKIKLDFFRCSLLTSNLQGVLTPDNLTHRQYLSLTVVTFDEWTKNIQGQIGVNNIATSQRAHCFVKT